MINRLLNRTNEYFEKVPDTLRKHRRMVWITFILLTAGVSMGIGNLTIDMSLEAFFEQNDPAKKAYDRFRVLFGGDENVYIVYEAKDGDILSKASLKALYGIQEDLLNYRLKLKPGAKSPLDHIADVKTLINVKYLEAEPESLISRSFIGTRFPQNKQERENYRKLAWEHHEYPFLYLSENSAYGGIVIKTDFNAELVYADPALETESVQHLSDTAGNESNGVWDAEEDEFTDEPIDMTQVVEDTSEPVFKKTEMHEYTPFASAIRKILNKPEYAQVLTFYPVGNPIFMSDLNDLIMKELNITVGGLIFLIMLMLWLLFRSFSAVVWPTAIIIFSMLWVVGLIGLSGVAMTSMIQIIVYLVLAIGVADAVHILSGYLFFRNQKMGHEEALRAVFKKSGLACFLTSLTTSVGLISLIFVPIVPIQSFGVFASLGVLFAFIFTIVLLPLMLDLWSPFSEKRARKVAVSGGHTHVVQRLLNKIERTGYRNALPIIIIFGIIGMFFLIGVFKVNVDYNMIEVLEKGFHIRDAYELVDKQIGGTGSMEILIDTGRVDGLKRPEMLSAIEALQEYIEETHKTSVVNTNSLADVTKDSYKTLNEGRKEMNIIPQDPRILAQTLFLFNNANAKDRRQLVTDDYRIGRVNIALRNVSSQEAEAFIKDVEKAIDRIFKPLKAQYTDMNIIVTGQLSLLARILNFLSRSQIKSFGLTLAVISVLMLIVLGSRKIGFIALFPNLFPILTIFGLMGWLKIDLDTDTLLIAPIIIGIAVDDTIHFLTHYRIEIEKCGDIKTAIVRTLREVGQAMVFTSLILSIGFLVFIFSVHNGLNNFGILSAVAIMAALLADLFMLPAMLVFFDARMDNCAVPVTDGGKK